MILRKYTIKFTSQTSGNANQPPVANAGTNIVIQLPTNSTTLNGSGSDSDGTIISYLWTQIVGPNVAGISNTAIVNPNITGLIQGSYVFQLTVTDNLGLTDSDSVSVDVIPAGGNIPPIAEAGPNQTIALPTNSISLDGSASYDPDGSIVAYLWTKISGPSTYTIVSPTSVITAVNNLVQGVYLFQLQVTDNLGATGIDVVTITVNLGGIGIPSITTGSSVKMPLWGFSMENSWFTELNGNIYHDIMSEPFFSHVTSIRPYILSFPGTQPPHYEIYLLNDNTPDAPIGNGGFNCALCDNVSTNCCVSYPTSFFPKFIQFADAIGSQVILMCNPQQFTAANYLSAMNYANSQCGLFGMILAQEFNINYVQCGLCGINMGPAVASACSTIISGIYPTYPGIFYTSDWNGINGTEASIRTYGTAQLAIPHTTDMRVYASERTFAPDADWVNGRTGLQYKASIDNAVDVEFPSRIQDLLTTGKKLAITSWYSDDIHDFKGKFLQYYFLARYKVKEILEEAVASGTLSYSLFRRFDTLNAKMPNMNDQGNLILMLKEFFIQGNEVYTLTLPAGMQGVACVNPSTKNGKAIIINSTGVDYFPTYISVLGVGMPITPTITSLAGTGLLTTCNYASTLKVPGYAISLLDF